jgi:hypothetical protein
MIPQPEIFTSAKPLQSLILNFPSLNILQRLTALLYSFRSQRTKDNKAPGPNRCGAFMTIIQSGSGRITGTWKITQNSGIDQSTTGPGKKRTSQTLDSHPHALAAVTTSLRL